MPGQLSLLLLSLCLNIVLVVALCCTHCCRRRCSANPEGFVRQVGTWPNYLLVTRHGNTDVAHVDKDCPDVSAAIASGTGQVFSVCHACVTWSTRKNR